MMVSLTLPNGEPAARTDIGVTTVDVSTLDVQIEVVGYDADDNKLAVTYVPYKINELRELPREELEAVVTAFFADQK